MRYLVIDGEWFFGLQEADSPEQAARDFAERSQHDPVDGALEVFEVPVGGGLEVVDL